MILSRERIAERVRRQSLIEGYEEHCLGGAGYDLRAGRVYSLEGPAALGVQTQTPPALRAIDLSIHTLAPGGYVLVETIERVNLPADLAARILPRSSLFRYGGSLQTALVDPGFRGTLTLGLANLGPQRLTLEKGARVAQIVFETVEGRTRPYAGRYQGGKVV